MNDKTLYMKLKEAYTEANLNSITTRIINMYRDQQFDNLLLLGRKLKDFIAADATKVNRLFNSLIMLYHPDKLNYYMNALEKYKRNSDENKLTTFSHILIVQEAFTKSLPADNFDFQDLYVSQVQYGFDEDDLDTLNRQDDLFGGEDYRDVFNDFLWAIQKKENINFNDYSIEFYLQQLNGELDMSCCDICDLNGIEHCINVTVLDLSYNKIIDISALAAIESLETLYLSNNNISDITALAGLLNLRYVDLSFNDVSDVRILAELEHLEFANVIGNKIPAQQTDILRSKGVVLIF